MLPAEVVSRDTSDSVCRRYICCAGGDSAEVFKGDGAVMAAEAELGAGPGVCDGGSAMGVKCGRRVESVACHAGHLVCPERGTRDVHGIMGCVAHTADLVIHRGPALA